MIMDAFLACLKTKRMSQIRVADLTRMNGMVHSHFYAYFKNLDEVVLALARQVVVCPPSLVAHAAKDWTAAGGVEHARGLVREYLEIARAQGELRRLLMMLADEIGGEYLRLRVEHYRPLVAEFEAKVRAAQAAGGAFQGVEPAAVAYKMVSLLGTSGNSYEAWRSTGFSDDALVDTVARMLHLIATGGCSPRTAQA